MQLAGYSLALKITCRTDLQSGLGICSRTSSHTTLFSLSLPVLSLASGPNAYGVAGSADWDSMVISTGWTPFESLLTMDHGMLFEVSSMVGGSLELVLARCTHKRLENSLATFRRAKNDCARLNP